MRRLPPLIEFAPARGLAERRRAGAGVPRQAAPRDCGTMSSIAPPRRDRRQAWRRSDHRRPNVCGRRPTRRPVRAAATQGLWRETTTRVRSGSWASARDPWRACARGGAPPRSEAEALTIGRFGFVSAANRGTTRARLARRRNGHRDASFALCARAAVMAARCNRIDCGTGRSSHSNPSSNPTDVLPGRYSKRAELLLSSRREVASQLCRRAEPAFINSAKAAL